MLQSPERVNTMQMIRCRNIWHSLVTVLEELAEQIETELKGLFPEFE